MYYLLINFYLVSLPFILTTSLYCVNLQCKLTRGHPYKLYLPRCSTDIRKYFFSQRIVKLWNELPANTDFSSIGIVVSNDLKCNAHIAYIIHKANSRLHFLRQLKRAAVPRHDMLHFYIAVIRPVLEYAVPVWHTGLTCLLYTSPSPRDGLLSRMPSSA